MNYLTFKEILKGSWFTYVFWRNRDRVLLKTSNTTFFDPDAEEFINVKDSIFVDNDGDQEACLGMVEVNITRKR